MKTTIPCKVCGQPLELDIPDDIREPFAKAVTGSLALVVHEACAAKKQSEIDAGLLRSVVADRRKTWETKCPKAYQSTEAAKLPNQKASAKAMEWTFAGCGGRGLVLHSSVSGAGKTRTAFLLLEREYVGAGTSFIATSHTQFARDAVELQFSTEPQALRNWMQALKKVKILLMDDLGKSRTTISDGSGSRAEEALFDLLDDRFTNGRPVIITSNFAGGELETRFSAERGPYLVRRLREFCNAVHFGK